MQLQRLASECGGAVGRRELLRVSRQYRSSLEFFAQQLDDIARTMTDDDMQEDEMSIAAATYRDIHMTWELCEILYIDPDSIITRLPIWFRIHFPKPDLEDELQALSTMDQPERHPQYWDNIFKLVITGRLEEARLLLQRHSQAAAIQTRTDKRVDVFSVLDTLLKSLAKIRSNPSAGEFRTSWEQWRHDCRYIVL